MSLSFSFVVLIPALVALHLGAIAIAGQLFGVRLRLLKIGWGPALLRGPTWQLCLLPVGGSVKFKETREDFLSKYDRDAGDGFDDKSRTVQALIALSGVVALVALAVATRGWQGWNSFVSGIPQIVIGALSPWSDAQNFLGGASPILKGGIAPLAGLLAAKMAAFNLIPLPGTNGFSILHALFAPRQPSPSAWNEKLTSAGLLALFALYVSWLGALVQFFYLAPSASIGMP